MLPAPPRDAFPVLDWIMSRHVHEYLDVAGRPIGEGRAAAFQHVPTEMQSCPYAGKRFHHEKPMNVSALREILPVWDEIVTMLSWLSKRYQDRYQKEITTFDDLSLVTSAGIFLADFLVLRQHRAVRSHEVPLLVSGLYKVCLGFQLATLLGSLQERFADATTPPRLPDAAGFYDDVEAHDLLIGESEVCAGPQAMIMEAYEAMTGRHAIPEESLPPDCARLEIAWEQHDLFTDHAANLWNDLLMHAIQMPQFLPQLTDPRLPRDVQNRLNASLQERGNKLLAEQHGLVVDLARSAQDTIGPPDAAGLTEPPDPLLESPSLPPDSVAATVVTWLNSVAPADMQAHSPVVASALHAQLAPYDDHEAALLAGLNENLNCLMDALGLDRPSAPLTASVLSRVFGRTLRDWSDA